MRWKRRGGKWSAASRKCEERRGEKEKEKEKEKEGDIEERK